MLLKLVQRLFLAVICLMAYGHVAAQPAPYITAAIHWPNGKAQFFRNDGTYLRFDIAANRADAGYPKPINDKTWPGMGPYARQILAAFNGPQGKAYFFLASGQYLRYDIAADQVDPGYPKLVDDNTWPGLAPYRTMVFGALNWPGNRVQIFLSNGTYVRYDLSKNRVEDGYPKPIDNKTWPGLQPFAAHLAGMVNWDNNKAYIFLDDNRYLRYDIAADQVDAGYPKPVTDVSWPGMGSAFVRRAMP
jgi:Hemopexin